MKEALIDTDILSMFFRGHPDIVAHFAAYTAVHGRINFSIITYYEIVSGLKHRDAHKQLEPFMDFAVHNHVVPLTEQSVTVSAQVYADTRARGYPIDDIDILIAGIAMAKGWLLVTHNQKHFGKITGLEVQDWSEKVTHDQ